MPNFYPLTAYEDLSPLCDRGHVVLVKNRQDGHIYVKKYLQGGSTEVYRQLLSKPVPGTPRIYGIYEVSVETPPCGIHESVSCGHVPGNAYTSPLPDTRLILIEEYLPGSTLAECMSQRGLFSEKETIEIIRKLCRILTALHSTKPAIVHRDVKPSNVMLCPDGTVKLLDFNAARRENASQNRDTQLLGTAGFAAPEQYGFSSSTAQTDIYALGVLMNVMLTGALPYEKLAEGKCSGLIRRCLEVNPKDRFQNMKQVDQALKRAQNLCAEWLPPGFRTLRIPNMLIASAAYAALFIGVFNLHSSSMTNPGELMSFRLCFLGIGLCLIAFFCNYLGLRRFFPFMRSRNGWLRRLGFVLGPFLIIWTLLIIHVATVVMFL